MATEKDCEQDRLIHDNALRIARNEEAIKRQTEALEKIRDHYYPPPERWWKRALALAVKIVCVIFAYLGIAQTVDWIWKTREADTLAEHYAAVGRRLYGVEGDIRGAMACYEKAVEIDPKESDYLMMLTFLKGMVLVSDYADNGRPPTDAEQARIDAALAEATVLKELQTDSPMPYILMAQAYALGGEREEALAAIDQAVARAPERASVRVSACAIHHLTGDKAGARACLTEAERLDPSLPLMLAWKGILAIADDGDAAAARTYFEKTIARMPRIALLHLYLGQVLLAEKSPDLVGARASFNRALLLDANLTGAMLGLAESYERENNRILARLWLDRALTVDGQFLPALLVRARVCSASGDFAAAVRDLTAAIALDPFRGSLYELRAAACEKTGDAARAQADRATAAALAKRNVL